MSARNRRWILARTPPGGWPADEDFAWREPDVPDAGPGQMLTRTLYLSLDPYQWGRLRSALEPPGDACHGRTVSQVIARLGVSRNEGKENPPARGHPHSHV